MVNMEGPVRERLLPLLKVGEAVSGEELAARLGVSRVAVWKGIKELKGRGVQVASGRRGYWLSQPADLISIIALEALLKGCLVGGTIVYRESVDSTQSLARALVEGGAHDGLIVVAERQSEGRGRMGRKWVSDAGGLWFTIAIRPKVSPAFLQACTSMVSLSVRDSIRALLGREPLLKWPNDVLVGKGKVCGVLSEVAASADEIRYVLLGVGVNVNNDVRSIGARGTPAASLKELLGHAVQRDALLVSIIKGVDMRYRRARKEGFGALLDEYRASCSTVGKRVRVEYTDSVIEGMAVGIDELGALVVKSDGKVFKAHSGDVVHLRARRLKL